MNKLFLFLIFVLLSTETAKSQRNFDNILRTRPTNIQDSCLHGIIRLCQESNDYLTLPYKRRDNLRHRPSYWYEIIGTSFYANQNRKCKKQTDEDSFLSLFKESTGDYILGELFVAQGGWLSGKCWLVTFDLKGKLIDYLPIYEWGSCDGAPVIEGELHTDFTVSIQQLHFPGYDYIARFEPIISFDRYPDELIGQRIDSEYRITPQGKFEQTSEILYKPQDYAEIFRTFDEEHPVAIRQRNEQRLEGADAGKRLTSEHRITNIDYPTEGEWRDTIWNDAKNLVIKGAFTENDTLFYLQEFLKDSLHPDAPLKRNVSAYQEPDRHSRYYSRDYWMEYFHQMDYDEDYLQDWEKDKKEKNISLRKMDTFGLPDLWVPLEMHVDIPNSKPFVCTPFQYDYWGLQLLNDSLLITRERLFKVFNWIEKSEKLSDSKFHFVIHSAGTYSTKTDLYIYILDEKSKMSIWEYRDSESDSYRLMLPVESISYCNMLVFQSVYQDFKGDPSGFFNQAYLEKLLEEVVKGKRKTLFNN